MNFKIRSAILFTTLVAIILLVSYVIIYVLYANFKEDEFYLRLEQKALTTYKFLTEVKEIDEHLLKVIDRNTINELYDEKVLIFNEHHQLIYSSIDDHAITYSEALLDKVDKQKNIRYESGEIDIVAMAVSYRGVKGIVLASADDKFGRNKLQNLFYILLFSYLAALMITAALSYFYVRQSFAPIDILNSQITKIRQNRVNERVPVTQSHDELNQLAINFNQMLERIESAFRVQKSFIQHASHELRTPLAKLITSCELALKRDLSNEEYHKLIYSLNEEHKGLVELTNSLLLLSQYENENKEMLFSELRADEILFEAIEDVQEAYPQHVFRFEFRELPRSSNGLSVNGNEVLIKTALVNLLRNACKYSTNADINVSLIVAEQKVVFEINNEGPILEPDELDMWKEPFFRGRNSNRSKGHGLGLAIAYRIAEVHDGMLSYKGVNNKNTFLLSLPDTQF